MDWSKASFNQKLMIGIGVFLLFAAAMLFAWKTGVNDGAALGYQVCLDQLNQTLAGQGLLQ